MADYVTVVSVDLNQHQPKCQKNDNPHSIEQLSEKKSSFVTVLSINSNQNNTTTISTKAENSEIVTVYRLPGERLGFGLKFQGGTMTNERVERLFIQSCDANTPASRARTSWGESLSEGDEILEIDNEPVTNMTRIECVKCLKDKNVAINLLVRKGDRNSMKFIKSNSSTTKRSLPPPPPPPKIPPRKIYKKPQISLTPAVANKVDLETPVAAEMYLNCTLDDEQNHNDESDETGSTISSQISVISNFSSESDLSLLSSNNDLARILTKPFQMIEREFNVVPPMSIENLLMFNESELLNENVNDEIKMIGNVNIAIPEYENINVKLQPVPLPRSLSMPPETGVANTTIESWLNDAKAVSDTTIVADKNSNTESDAQNYEAIKFECFAATDDTEDKLGPPELLLNISEAYFNIPWNSTNSLPTIGEAEEEFSSMEHFGSQNIVNGPVFILHDESLVDSKNSIEITEAKCNQQRKNMEINNNEISSYLHERKDKSDNLIPSLQSENEKSNCATKLNKKDGVKNTCIPMEAKVNEIIKSSRSENDKSLNSINDNDECSKFLLDEHTKISDEKLKTVFNLNESVKSDINNEAIIKCDREYLETKESSSNNQNISVAISDDKNNNDTFKMMQSKISDDEIETDRTETATTTDAESASTISSSLIPIVQQRTIAKMDQKQLSIEHFSVNSVEDVDSSSNILETSSKKTSSQSIKIDNSIDTNKFSSTNTPKATAIVAPQRKTHHFEEITNFVDTKPPFKSATLGRQRTQFNYRNKDEKSEKSVRDKIAMFSNSTSDILHILPKSTSTTKVKDKSFRSIAKSTENIFNSGSAYVVDNSKMKNNGLDFVMKKKAISVENLDNYNDEKEMRDGNIVNYTPVSKPTSLHSPSFARLNINRAQSVEHLNTPALPTSRPPLTAPISQLTRHISFNGYASDNSPNRKIDEGNRFANIIENRKKSMSKLRGLVIPEKVPENELNADQKVFNLPVIRSKECELIDTIKSVNNSPMMSVRKNVSNNKMELEIRPALRKTLEDDRAKISPPIKPPRTSLIFPTTKSSLTNLMTATDESDTESCMSSKILTPPISPVAKKPLIRTLSSNSSISSNSTLTSGSGSQASCSSNVSNSPETRKTSTDTTSTATRKSIVASSKSRSEREHLDKSWRDEDSTDGGIDDEKHRIPKAKARSSLINYKLINHGDNLADKVINVATYVEVMSSDSEEKIETSESMSKITTQKTITVTKSDLPETSNDMAKWVRKEVSKTTEIVKKVEKTEEIRKIPKSLDTPKKLNFSEIRKNFESKHVTSPSIRTPTKDKTPISAPATTFNHNRFSSWDSIASSSSGVSSELLGTGTGTNNSESLQTIQSDFGSFSSFGSSHSLITPQDLQSIIDEADPPLETSEAFVVVLHRETPESSIGITLAGGSDYETKEITIHRILMNSPADKDGRLKKGDRLLSINGLSMRGLTHRESLSVLKSPRTDVVMVVTRSKSIVKTNSLTKSKLGSLGSLCSLSEHADVPEINIKKTLHTSKSVDMDLDAISNDVNDNEIVSIIKDGSGIGISLEGGYDSLCGNKPLTIKKIFMGGAAEKFSNLKAGDEILEINGISTEKQTRIDVWNMIKRLPSGDTVQLKIKRC
ncbi:hypothetical protein PVAND_003626 [Polypedilum vanderplanki]|uniref:PDZ domain-containing protein n=1 Tax=Polypedilum vanderplanki TaxID=319348 RepID=A0A9J6BV57_POLVA|nr:hypothetical protein PVAND_003626 [Polypedilum vanderplanki]